METCPIPPKTRVNLTLSLHPLQPLACLCMEPSPRSCSSTSESSLVSPLHDSRSKDKRERSPTTKIEKDFDFKKPRPRCPLQKEWQTAGNKAATEFLSTGPILQSLITKTNRKLENLIPRIMKAADDFRDVFPNFFDSDSSLSIKLRNEERHFRFASLQLELMIPTRAQGTSSASKRCSNSLGWFGKPFGDNSYRGRHRSFPYYHRSYQEHGHQCATFYLWNVALHERSRQYPRDNVRRLQRRKIKAWGRQHGSLLPTSPQQRSGKVWRLLGCTAPLLTGREPQHPTWVHA